MNSTRKVNHLSKELSEFSLLLDHAPQGSVRYLDLRFLLRERKGNETKDIKNANFLLSLPLSFSLPFQVLPHIQDSTQPKGSGIHLIYQCAHDF